MKRKLTIRRVGSHIPTITLVGFLFLCITIAWLSLVGLPDSLLRKIEQIAARQGIHLKVDAVRLSPFRGLSFVVDNVRIHPTADAPAPLFRAKSAAVDVNTFRLLFRAHFCLSSAEVKNADFQIPVSDEKGEYLDGRNMRLSAKMTPEGDIHITKASLNLEGVDVQLSGDILHREQQVVEEVTNEEYIEPEPEPIDVPAQLTKVSPYTDKIYHIIRQQNWQANETPQIRLHVTIGKKPAATLHAEIPRFDYDIFHFRKALADIEYKNNTVFINRLSFTTIDPDSAASLRGAYEIKERNVEFELDSDAALLAIANSVLGEDSPAILSKFRHDAQNRPHIKLKGSVGLEPNLSLRTLTLNGELSQKMLYVEETCIDDLVLNFYYKDGNFTINNITAAFANNTLNLKATANNGRGNAELSADVDVETALQLVNKFTGKPLALPDEVKIGRRMQIQSSANLTTPIFAPGQTNWQDFTPSVQDITLSLSLDKLNVCDTELKAPTLRIALSGITQNEDLIPVAAKQAKLSLRAEEITHADGIRVTAPSLKLDATEISYRRDTLDIATLSLTPEEANLATQIITPWVETHEMGLNLQLANLHYEADDFSVEQAKLNLHTEHLRQDDIEVSDLDITIPNLLHFTPLAPKWTDILNVAQVRASASDIIYEKRPLGNMCIEAHLAEGQKGKADITYRVPSATEPDTLITNNVSTEVDWTNTELLKLSNMKLNLAPISFAGLLEHFQIALKEIKLPEALSAKGQMTFNTKTLRPTDGTFSLDIPELVRTPIKNTVFRGQEVPIGVSAQVVLTPEEKDELRYRADVTVTHKKDAFKGVVKGSTEGWVLITGTNTIRADVVDKLIDSYAAHSIIRDFRFGSNGSNNITDIDVKVDYAGGGLSVDSYCRADLRNTDYLLGSVLVDEHGNETLRTDLSKNPYTLAKRATCYVRTRIRYPENADGKKIRNECVITIGDINMTYDNRPWFERMQNTSALLNKSALAKVRNKNVNTTMTGDAVIIDVENSFVELVNIKGTVYPAYSLGMYFAPLYYILGDIVLPYPAQVETKSCVFPIYSDCKRPMSGLIKVKVPQTAGFRFLGTTIPLQNFSGFIKLSDRYVTLDKMNAACWEGVLDATVKIGITGKHTSFDGFVNAANMNLSSILASYDTEYSSALCNGYLRFRSPSSNINDIQGYGEANVTNGDLMGFTLFQPISALVTDLPSTLLRLETAAKNKKNSNAISSIFTGTGNAIRSIGTQARRIPGYNHLFAYDLQNVFAKFAIGSGKLRAYDMEAEGYNLDVKMKVEVDLHTTNIRGNLWPRITSLPTIILSPITFLSDFMIDIIIYGKIDDLKWKVGLDRRLKSDKPSFSDKKSDNTLKPRSAKKAQR